MEDSVAIENPLYDVDPDEKPGVVAYHKPEDDDEEEQVKVRTNCRGGIAIT